MLQEAFLFAPFSKSALKIDKAFSNLFECLSWFCFIKCFRPPGILVMPYLHDPINNNRHRLVDFSRCLSGHILGIPEHPSLERREIPAIIQIVPNVIERPFPSLCWKGNRQSKSSLIRYHIQYAV